LLQSLHEVGTQRDKAQNRQLHFDQYGALLLLYFFNPVLTSLRGIQQASHLEKVQKKLGCRGTSLGSLSERNVSTCLRHLRVEISVVWTRFASSFP
jgi:hypothetical protein